MHPNAERVQQALRSLGTECQVLELPASTHSAADAAKAIGTSVAKIVKTVVFQADGQPILVLASGTNRVSLAKLQKLVGNASRADADAVKRLTGFSIGGVAPVGLSQPMTVLIDADLSGEEQLWAAAGTPHAVFRCSASELARLSGGRFEDVKEDRKD
jgi:prolyl-tRNA editing enzyme YbaK/EbsC (Cys-tRNA(Pro) deacylase)